MVDNWQRPFWRSVFSGTDGRGSTSRVLTFFVVIVANLWATYIVVRTRTLPDFTNLSWWVCTLVTFLYGTNKASAFANLKAAKKEPTNG